MRNLSLGIVAHVDAGKTTLTERLLYAAGIIDELGSVDRGDTQTDSLALERRRGITIKSAVVSFEMHGVRINLIDTPGHPDFIAEVERALSVLDGAVLVVSAVEGVQPQTRVLMRALRRLALPTLIFVNKIDRAGADDRRTLDAIRARLTSAVVALNAPTDVGTKAVSATALDPDEPAVADELVDLLTQHDDAMLADYVERGRRFGPRELRDRLTAQTAHAHVHPVVFGSAMTGVGVETLTTALPMLGRRGSVPDDSVSATVFKVERTSAGTPLAYLRVFSGAIRPRSELSVNRERIAKATSVKVFDRGGLVDADRATAGRIAVVGGLGAIRIGDVVGREPPRRADRHFAPPTLETVVVPDRSSDRGALHLALTQLAEQDPLINVREDSARGEVRLSLYGEVQKEVIQATLAEEFGVGVAFRESTTLCIERPQRSGAAVEVIKGEGNPFLATVGLRVEPAEAGSGVRFEIEVELGSMPYAFFKVVEETARATLRQGLNGWPVDDCAVVMTHSGYCPKSSIGHAAFHKSLSSTGTDFRGVTPLVVMAALSRAGTQVYEPMHRYVLEVPEETLTPIALLLSRLRSAPQSIQARGRAMSLEGAIPAAQVHRLSQELPGLTRGEGVLETAFERYRAVHGDPPRRRRIGPDPRDRKSYLLATTRQRLNGRI